MKNYTLPLGYHKHVIACLSNNLCISDTKSEGLTVMWDKIQKLPFVIVKKYVLECDRGSDRNTISNIKCKAASIVEHVSIIIICGRCVACANHGLDFLVPGSVCFLILSQVPCRW